MTSEQLYPRPAYLAKLHSYQDPQLVKVLVGVRRSGKSKLLELFGQELIETGLEPSHLITVDYEMTTAQELRDPQALFAYVEERLPSQGPAFLFVDEIQELRRWAHTINGLRAEFPQLDIYVTGSNSKLFAGEDLTYLSGRYVKVDVYPLSFAEYLTFCDIEIPPFLSRGFSHAQPSLEIAAQRLQVEAAFENYLNYGSFPAVALAKNDLLASALLDGLFDSIFSRDIMLKGKIENEEAFLRVARFAIDNIGNQTSPAAVARALKASGHPMSANTIDRYLSLMEQAYFLYRCERFDVRGKERLKTNGKYYAIDLGLRRHIVGSSERDRGHIIENLVYLELKRRGYNVFCGSLPNAEIDFVASSPHETRYFQISETVTDPAVRERELKPFGLVHDHHPCFLITNDKPLGILDNGVTHVNLLDFLLGYE